MADTTLDLDLDETDSSQTTSLSTTHTAMTNIIGIPRSTSAGLGDSSHQDDALLLNDLTIKIGEAHSAASTLYNEIYSRWMGHATNRYLTRVNTLVTGRLTVELSNADSLTDQQREFLRVVLQTSRFAVFLEEQENLSSYGAKRDDLTDLKGRLEQVTCAAHQLLTVSDSDLQTYVTTSVQHSFSVLTFTDGIRRSMCAEAVKLIRDFLDAIDL